MKTISKFFFLSVLLAVAAVSVIGCADDRSLSWLDEGVSVRINGLLQNGTVNIRKTGQGVLVDARAFAVILGVRFSRMRNPTSPGIVLQYGNRISFAGTGFEFGFCSTRKTAMVPPMEMEGDDYWAPLDFFAGTIDGQVRMAEGSQVIDVVLPPPGEIGDIVPQARAIARELEGDFFIRQGQISLTNAIEVFTAGYLPDCNGNNAGNSYLVSQNPLSPRTEVFNRLPLGFQMDQDEAFVWVGYTPPECKYFSYQHYLMTRFFPDEDVPLKKIYARLGDSINNFNIPLNANPFRKFYVFIIANNQTTHDWIENAVLNAGIARDRILTLVIPSRTEPGIDMNFGPGMTSDSLTFLHRATLFARDTEKEEYIQQPTLEILRVTPRTELAPNPMDRPVPRERHSLSFEQDIPGLAGLIEQLRTEITAAHGGSFQYTRLLKTSTWMFPGGDKAIEDRINVLGETNDTLYLRSENFVLHRDDLVVVFGANHARTGKAVYGNVSCYGAQDSTGKSPLNGIGGVTSEPWTPESPGRISYSGTAEEYLPDVDPASREMLYVYKFARSPIDESTFVIPYNHDGSYLGHNDGDTVFMGFRMYVDPLTTIGPYPGNVTDGSYWPYTAPPDSEVFFDQAILFTNTAP